MKGCYRPAGGFCGNTPPHYPAASQHSGQRDVHAQPSQQQLPLAVPSAALRDGLKGQAQLPPHRQLPLNSALSAAARRA